MLAGSAVAFVVAAMPVLWASEKANEFEPEEPGNAAVPTVDEDRPSTYDDEVGYAKDAKREKIRPFHLSLANYFGVGIAGDLKNPSPAYDLTLDLAFPTGLAMRYHVEVAFQDLNDHLGLRLGPLTLGYEIPISQSFLPPSFSIGCEIMLAVVQAEALFQDLFAISLSSALRAQFVVHYDQLFIAATLIGIEARYAYGVQNVGIRSGFGMNWPLGIAVGVDL